MAPVKKSIYSLFILTQIFKNATKRYLEFISSFDDPTDGLKKLNRVVEPITKDNSNYEGFNFFSKEDERILILGAVGKFALKGITNKELRKQLPEKSTSQLSRILKRLQLHGLIKKSEKLTNTIYQSSENRSLSLV